MASLLDGIPQLVRAGGRYGLPNQVEPFETAALDDGLLAQGMSSGDLQAAPQISFTRAAAPAQGGAAAPTPAVTGGARPGPAPMGMAPYVPPAPTNKVGDILDSMTGNHFAARRQREANIETRARNSYRSEQALAESQQRRQEAATIASRMQLSDPDNYLRLTDEEKFADVLKSRQEAANVAGGDTRTYGEGRGVYQAPKLVGDNGVYGTQTPDGFTETGRRQLTAKELADIEAERRRLAISQGQLGVAQGHLGVARQRANSPGGGDGGGGIAWD